MRIDCRRRLPGLVLLAAVFLWLPGLAASQDASAPQSRRLPPLTDTISRIEELERRIAQLETQLAPTARPEELPPPIDQQPGIGAGLLPLWQHGLQWRSPSGDFWMKFGGIVQFDTTFFNESAGPRTPILDGGVGPINNAVNFRRGRLRAEGTMYGVLDWMAEYDFVNEVNVLHVEGNPPGFPGNVQGPPGLGPLAAVPSVTNLYLTVTQLPLVGNFRAGNFKEPIGFERLTSVRWLNFMERSYNMDAFYGPFNNGYGPGFMLFDWTADERGTWALWAGPNQGNIFGYGIGNQWAGTVRGTRLVYFDEPSGGNYLVHVGSSLSTRGPEQGQAQVRTRGEIWSGPPSSINPIYANTGSFATTAQQLINLEAVAVWGPLTLQSEYCGSWFEDATTNPANPVTPPAQRGLGGPRNVFFQGVYVEALWFLTGESRGYDRHFAVLDRVIPHTNFFWLRTPGATCLGWGAWQLGARYSMLDLNADGFNGGLLNTLTLGLNWFWNPNMKIQFNYDYTHRGRVDQAAAGDINGFGIRVATDF